MYFGRNLDHFGVTYLRVMNAPYEFPLVIDFLFGTAKEKENTKENQRERGRMRETERAKYLFSSCPIKTVSIS